MFKVHLYLCSVDRIGFGRVLMSSHLRTLSEKVLGPGRTVGVLASFN